LSTSMTAVFQTEYDGAGVDEAVAGQRKIQKSLETTGESAEASGLKMESLFRRLERPIGAIAFMGLSQQIADVGTKGQTSAQMLERGFHAAGSALMFFNPELGIAVIAAGALFEVFEKINHQKTADELEKGSEAARQFSDASREAADYLEKQSIITKEQADRLRDTSVMKKQEADDLRAALVKQETDNAKELADAQKIVDAQKDEAWFVQGKWANQAKVNDLKKKELEIQEALTSLGKNSAQDASAKTDQLKLDLMTKQWLAEKNLDEATKELKTDESLLAANEAAIISETDAKRLASFEDQEEQIKKRIQLENEYINSLQDGQKKETSAMDDLKESVANQLGQLATVYSKSGKDISKIEKDMLSGMITDFANAEAGKLQLAGMADIFINPALGLAELAGAAAITALSSQIAGAIGGSSGGASTPAAVASSSISAPGGGGSGAGPGQGGNTYIYLQGNNVIDPSTVSLILKGLNQLQQNNGWSLGSNYINGQAVAPGNM